jgi:hypothetical protein
LPVRYVTATWEQLKDIRTPYLDQVFTRRLKAAQDFADRMAAFGAATGREDACQPLATPSPVPPPGGTGGPPAAPAAEGLVTRRRVVSVLGTVTAAMLISALFAEPSQADNLFPIIKEGQSQQSQAVTYRKVFVPGTSTPAEDLTLGSTADTVCLFNGVQGKMRGNTWALVHRSAAPWAAVVSAGTWAPGAGDDGPEWKLTAFTTNAQVEPGRGPAQVTPVAAGATCVPKSAFITDPGGAVTVSPRADLDQIVQTQADKCTYTLKSTPLWWGDASGYIGGLKADFGDWNDSMEITSTTPNEPRTFTARNGQCWAANSAAAYSLLTGNPLAGNWPNLSGRGSQTYHVEAGHGHETPMAPTSAGVCFFTKLGGRWDGNGEAAWIWPQMIGSTEHWTVDIKAGTGGAIDAAVQCISYDQRHAPQSPS